MADHAGTFLDKLGGRLRAIRPTVTWIYCSAILFPMAFALVAAAVLTVRHPGASESAVRHFFALFYLSLMVLLASVPRSIAPILVIWLALARLRPAWDERPAVRYPGLLVLMGLAVLINTAAQGRGFSLPWALIGWLSLSLPRLAFPSLRPGLGRPAA